MSEATETDQIERDLARTRARMDHRLDELQDRLSPGQLVNDAFAYFKGGDGADFTQDVLAKLKANPLPALLTGIGIAWLMASSNRPAHADAEAPRGSDLDMRLRAAEAGIVRRQDEHPETYAGRIDEARGKVLGVVRNPSDTSTGYGQRIKEALASATQSARETAHDLSAGASGVAGQFGEQARRGGLAVHEGMGTMARSTRDTLAAAATNPIALGAIAAVIGLVAGSLIPTSDQEERALGATADKLRTAGRDLAQDVVDHGGRVVNQALDTARDSAERAGLSTDKPIGEAVAALRSGELAGSIKQVAADVVEAGKAAAGFDASSGEAGRS